MFQDPKANLDQTTKRRISYIFKRTGGEWRIINVDNTFNARARKPVKLDTKQLDELIGVYDGGNSSEILTVTHESGKLYGKFPEQEKFEMFPDTEIIFVGGGISIAFIRDSNGEVTQTVVYYSMPDDRLTIQTKVK